MRLKKRQWQWTAQHGGTVTNKQTTITSGILNTGVTSSCGNEDGSFVATGKQSNKIFQIPTGCTARATEVKLLQHNIREPAQQINVVPGIKTDLLISMAKSANVDYFVVFGKNKVKIFDANNMKVEVTNIAILRGWRCNETGLWQIPLTENLTNNNTDTVLSRELLTKWLKRRMKGEESIHNVYKLNMQPEIV